MDEFLGRLNGMGRKFLFAAVASAIALPSLAGIEPAEREKTIKAGLKIVAGVDAKAAALGSKLDQSKNPEYQDAELVIAVNSRSLLRRLDDGFQTVHVTGTSGGDSDPEKRLKIESALSGLKLTEKFSKGEGAHVMPKYAYVIFPSSKNDNGYFGYYGDLFIVLKPGVKKRATWTPSDSFDLEEEIDKGVGISGLVKKGLLGTFTHGAQKIPKLNGRYFEAQIWGPVDAASIAEIVFPREYAPPHAMRPHMKRIFEKINQLGIPISIYDQFHAAYEAPPQLEPYLKRKKLKAGEYPTEIKVLTHEEERARMLKTVDFDIGEKPNLEEAAALEQSHVLPYLK